MREDYSGLPAWQFMSNQKARNAYGLGYRPSLLAGELHNQLVDSRVAEVAMPVDEAEFKEVIDAYETCIEEAPEELALTAHSVDARFGNDAGHVRKEPKFEDDVQTQDGKNLFHFNEHARRRWIQQFPNPSRALSSFFALGYDLHDALLQVAKDNIGSLEETHPNISKVFFPASVPSQSFLRILSYDAPTQDAPHLAVAKEHFDIGGMTLQAYADADGFWGQTPEGEKVDYPSHPGMAHMFAGMGFANLYEGIATPIEPLLHGVRPVANLMVKRHAIILFVDVPLVDFNVEPTQTLPQIFQTTA